MDSKMPLPSIYVIIITIVVVAGLLENRPPIDVLVVAVLFALASFIAYIPFIGFWMYQNVAARIMDWFGYGSFAIVYWIVTIWALIVYIASSVLVVTRIIHRL